MNRNVSILSVMVMMTVTVMATVTVAFATPNEGGNGQAKFEVCHKGQIITVAEPALEAHQRHGDDPALCENGETPPEPPPDGTTTELTTMATASVTLGAPISDTATLSGGINPTGTITFKAYGPDTTPNDTTDNCSGTAAYMSTVTVNGNGSYNSDPSPTVHPDDDFIPTQPGTYFWTADYSGDATNDPSSSPCNATGESSAVT